jgi:hypothetical protein
VDLRVAGIREAGAALVGAPDGGGVGAPGVGREIEDVAVAAGGKDDGVGGRVTGDFAGDEIAGDDALGLAVDQDEVEHLLVGVQLHAPCRPCGTALSRRRGGAAGRSGRGRRTCGKPGRRRRNGWRAGRRIRGRRARPARRTGR